MEKTETQQTLPRSKEPKTVQGLLKSALDMEDEIAHSIYRNYMERENWPGELKDDIFEEIRKYLNTLLDDTKRHKNIIKNLQSNQRKKDG
jgi:rubrerythrin